MQGADTGEKEERRARVICIKLEQTPPLCPPCETHHPRAVSPLEVASVGLRVETHHCAGAEASGIYLAAFGEAGITHWHAQRVVELRNPALVGRFLVVPPEPRPPLLVRHEECSIPRGGQWGLYELRKYRSQLAIQFTNSPIAGIKYRHVRNFHDK